jgi:hypothetical protein
MVLSGRSTSSPHKILVSNRSLLIEKYGQVAFEGDVLPALQRLVDADRRRGITTELRWLDAADDMAGVGGTAVRAKALSDPFTQADREAYKRAVDDVFRATRPHYLVLLGGPDIVPHQLLENPAFLRDTANGDDDVEVESDLPYASSAGFATQIAPFVTPDRVVGRLPDIPGSHDDRALQTFLRIIAGAIAGDSLPRDAYERVLAISAHAWQRSTEATIGELFPRGTAVRLSPLDGPEWTDAEMANLLHYINCHGKRNRPAFSGQDPRDPTNRPDAHTGVNVAKRAVASTVVVAECCFGAQLYDLSQGELDTDGDGVPDMSIAHAYLQRGAHCVFGSTSFSYGPPPGTVNDFADLICASFVRHLLQGRSTGEATLLARLEYAQTARDPGRPLEPIDLKTLAQFVLVGDPSAHPVLRPTGSRVTEAPATRGSAAMSPYAVRARAGARTRRRRTSAARAGALRDTVTVIGDEIPGRLSRSEAERVAELARRFDIAEPLVRQFAVRTLTPTAAAAPASAGPTATTAYVIVDRERKTGSRPSSVMVTALQVGEELVNVRAAHSK